MQSADFWENAWFTAVVSCKWIANYFIVHRVIGPSNILARYSVWSFKGFFILSVLLEWLNLLYNISNVQFYITYYLTISIKSTLWRIYNPRRDKLYSDIFQQLWLDYRIYFSRSMGYSCLITLLSYKQIEEYYLIT